jgi:hypothetical protein
MTCRACHLVDEQGSIAGGGNRTYADFARRSPLSAREDGKTHTPRTAPPLVKALLPRESGLLLHFDGEFTSVADLVKGAFTGRNFGWLPSEQAQAMAHLAHIIRDDDGSGELAQQYGGPYPVVLKGTAPSIPAEVLLPPEYRIDVTQASDAGILGAVAKLVEAYLQSLVFAQDDSGAFNGSPYGVFLRKNGLPRVPDAGETDLAYGRRLLTLIDNLTAPQFVSDEEYDAIHGTGVFAALVIPDLETRRANHDAYLPATLEHPEAQGPFRDIPSSEQPGRTDLGLWNVYANSDFPEPQAHIQQLLCAGGKPCLPRALPPKAIALFKTPGLHDLGHSAPYLHTGRKDTPEDVIGFYIGFSNLARAGQLRNGAPELQGMALNEDYQ